MRYRRTTVERAFELAGSGGFEDIQMLRIALKKEGFDNVDRHLDSGALKQQLRRLCEAKPSSSRAAAAASEGGHADSPETALDPAKPAAADRPVRSDPLVDDLGPRLRDR